MTVNTYAHGIPILEAPLTEEKILKDEWLEERELDPEELAAREAELMKMKHLLFYKERKMKALFTFLLFCTLATTSAIPMMQL